MKRGNTFKRGGTLGSKKALRSFSVFLASVAMVIGVFSIINRVGGYSGKPSSSVMAQTTVVQTSTPAETSSTQPTTVKKVSENQHKNTTQPILL